MLLPESLSLHNRDKYEFHYIYFLPWKDQMVGAIQDAGGQVTCMSANNNIQILRSEKKVRKYCLDHQIDLIHCHLPWAGFLGRLIHRTTNIPTVYTEHNKQERYHRITYILNKLTFEWQSRVLAVSQDVADSIQKNISPKVPVETVLNGVNMEKFQRDEAAGKAMRSKLGIEGNAPVVGTIAVFRFQKRLVEWLQVFSEIKKSNPEAMGVIVGDGPLKDEILQERDKLGLHDSVLMPGLQEEVRPYLSMMDVYMMTSAFEGLPIALLEAMSMQCAVVSTRAGGIAELVEDGKSGRLKDVDAWQSLSEDVEAVIKTPGLKAKLGKNARDRVNESFSMQRMVRDLEACYEEILLNLS